MTMSTSFACGVVALTLIGSPWTHEVVAMDAVTESLAAGSLHDGDGFHDNATDHHGDHHGVHLASINFDYVKQPLVITTFLLIVAVCKLGFHHANFLSSKVPESCLLIVLGTTVSAILHVTGIEHRYIVNFSTDLFFLYLLPPIILESAYSLHDRVFFDNLGTILLYAVIGTVLNCFIIAPTLYGLAVCGAMGPITVTLIQCFVFGALIVAVDPVAVLAIFQEIGVNDVLYFLVFGESLLNDAVTVVLYNTMKSFNQMETIPISQIFLGIGAFFTVSLGGLCIGILTGGFCAFLTKYTGSVRVVEPLAVFSLAYGSYLLAELFHFSGIISIIGCGLVQAQYAFHNISHKSHTTVVYFSKMLSTTCDSIIFMFLGLSLISEKHVWHTGFVLWSILLCLIIRFLIVYFLTFFANKFERLRTIDYEEQFIMAYGGLRGAVAFSLVAMLKESDLPSQPMFETATLAVIIFTVFVQGISIKPLVKCLRITSGTKNPVSIYEEINCHVTDHVLAGIEEICGHYGHNRVREMLDYFDNRYLRPWLMRDPKTKDDDIMELYEKIALQMHFENIAGTSMWTEFTSDYELYKPELILPDNVATDPDKAYLAMDIRRKSSILYPPNPFYGRRHSSVPVSPRLPHQQQQQQDASEKEAPDDVFFRPSDSNRRDPEASVSSEGQTSKDEEPPSPTKSRKKSIVDMLKRTFSSDEEDQVVEAPTVEDLRKWLVKNPTREVFHRKYDKNLTNAGETDILHHLHQKQLRTRRLSMALRSPSRSTTGSPYGTPFGSSENISVASRPKTFLNVITEGVPMETDQVPKSPRKSVAWPYVRKVPAARKRRLVHSATIDTDGSTDRRQSYPQHTNQAKKDKQVGMSSGCDSTPLLDRSPESPISDNMDNDTSSESRIPSAEANSSSTSPQSADKEKDRSMSSQDGGNDDKDGDNGDDKDGESRPPFMKSQSGISLKNRGHFTRQKTEESEGESSHGEEDSLL